MASRLDCPDTPDDCSTQQDRNDTYSAYVAYDADMEGAQADEESSRAR